MLYTPAAIAQNASETQMRARVNQAVADTNWAFTDSGVDTQICVVHQEKIELNGESTLSLSAIVQILQDPSDLGTNDLDTLNSVHALRKQVKADLVMMIINLPLSATGLAHSIYTEDEGPSFASKAFAVVSEAGLTQTGRYFFAHEVGHLMGSDHDSTLGGAFPYSRGMTGSGLGRTCPSWGTIMAQSVCSTCEALRFWSNPAILHCGLPIGKLDANDNARSMNATRATVAKFRNQL